MLKALLTIGKAFNEAGHALEHGVQSERAKERDDQQAYYEAELAFEQSIDRTERLLNQAKQQLRPK